MKIALANSIALLHPMVVFVILFGWFVPGIFFVQGLLLLSTLVSWVLTSKCILTVWEYKLRESNDQYEYGYIQYHARALFSQPPSLSFIKAAGLTYLILALGIWSFQYYQGLY